MKHVVVISGGIDSSTLAYKLVSEGDEVYALTFDYGQRHVREIQSSKAIAKSLGISHRTVDVSALRTLLASSALTNQEITVPEVAETEEHYESLKVTIVPNRNAIILSMAVGYAVSIGATKVSFGAHYSDRGVYPDCRKEFVDAFQTAMRLANDNDKLRVEAPFVEMTKTDVVKLGSKLGVPFQLTWSCYKGLEEQCGTCSSCRERKRAFLEAGVPDPTKYLDQR